MKVEELMRLFAKRIRRKIVALRIDQRELARRAGISEQTLSRYILCQRKPTVDMVIRIAQALECQPSELIDIDELLE